MPAVGHHEDIVDIAEQRAFRPELPMGEDAENLCIHSIFPDTMEVVQSRLRSPADIERGGYVGMCPIENALQLGPVGDFFEFHLLQGGSGDDETVVMLRRHVAERSVKGIHMGLRSVFRHMALHLHPVEPYGIGGVGKYPYKVGLGINLDGHQVEDRYPYGTLQADIGVGYSVQFDAFGTETFDGRKSCRQYQ